MTGFDLQLADLDPEVNNHNEQRYQISQFTLGKSIQLLSHPLLAPSSSDIILKVAERSIIK